MNRGIKVLQTSALPLGYGAILNCKRKLNSAQSQCNESEKDENVIIRQNREYSHYYILCTEIRIGYVGNCIGRKNG